MAKFSIRFYGRFVLAREKSKGQDTGRITFLAPGLVALPEIGLHTPVLTIARKDVVSDPVRTTIPPSWRAMIQATPKDSEQLMWDLTGTTVTVPGNGGVTFKSTALLPDLGHLENLMERPGTFDKRNLRPGPLVGATVQLNGGVVDASAAFANMAQFVPENEARSGNGPHGKGKQMGANALVNWVNVALDAQGAMDASGDERGNLVLVLSGKTNGMIVVQGGGAGATASISNLCSTCPRIDDRYDFEFGQYYSLLEETGADRLIPMVEHLGEQNCDPQSQVSYEV